jgi:glycosyltransferase involved in cell wall biosynthesis
MKIAILTSGVLPIPAVLGGAVENLVDMYLEYNEQYHLHELTIYSIWHPNIVQNPSSNRNRYVYINGNSLKAKLWKIGNRLLCRKYYYHESIEYYLHKALNHINKSHYDLIVVENRPGYALTLNQKCNTTYVLHLHNDFIYQGAKNITDICHTFQCIISVSDYITNRVKAVYENKEKCITVHNAIDIKCFQTAQAFSRQLLGLTSNDFVLVYSGRLIKEKGILSLIFAIKQLNNIPNLKLLIIGMSSYGKDKRSTPFIEQLKKESESIKDKVIYTGFVDYKQVPSYLKMANIAIVPSMWEEPFGLTVVEAMAAGLPLITTRSGGIPEICEGVAMIVDRENIVENLAAAILDLYEHPEKCKQMAVAALERSKLFDKETYAKNFFEALEGI